MFIKQYLILTQSRFMELHSDIPEVTFEICLMQISLKDPHFWSGVLERYISYNLIFGLLFYENTVTFCRDIFVQLHSMHYSVICLYLS